MAPGLHNHVSIFGEQLPGSRLRRAREPGSDSARKSRLGPGLLWLSTTACVGLGLGMLLSPSGVEANTPTRFSRAAIAMCQSGCDTMRDDQIRALCKLKCFKDPNTVAPAAARQGSTAAASQGSTAAASQGSTAAASPSSAAAPGASASPQITQAPSRAHTAAGAAQVQVQHKQGAPARDAGQCRRACDANTTLSDTDLATCKLGCDTEGPSVTTWSVSGSPAQVRCAKKCHCESSCSDDASRCGRSCNTMSNPDSRASCKLQCDNEVRPCQKSCEPSAPTVGCSCG